MVDQRLMKFGKLSPKVDERTLKLADYIIPDKLPTIPAMKDWADRIQSWPMMANDNLEDCTIAAAGHLIQLWTANAGEMVVVPDQDIIAAYSAITGYDPNTGENNVACCALDVLNFWRQPGIGEHTIGAFVEIDLSDHGPIQATIFLFGGAYVGLNLPLSAQNKEVWDVPSGGAIDDGTPGSWEKHTVPAVSYDTKGLSVVTWGALQRMTWDFWEAYVDEAYAILSKDWIEDSGHAPSGIDWESLKSDLQKVTN